MVAILEMPQYVIYQKNDGYAFITLRGIGQVQHHPQLFSKKSWDFLYH